MDNTLVMVLYFVVIIGAMYFLFIRPQKKRDKEAKEMLSALKNGDEIVTIGGIVGIVVNIKEDDITVETSIDKTKITFKKMAVKNVISLTNEDNTPEEDEKAE